MNEHKCSELSFPENFSAKNSPPTVFAVFALYFLIAPSAAVDVQDSLGLRSQQNLSCRKFFLRKPVNCLQVSFPFFHSFFYLAGLL